MFSVNQTQTDNRQRGGFTMIELLVAITIIAILAGLLLGGITAAMSSASTAKAVNEIKALETALAQFYAEYGMYPPSSIVLHETNAGWDSNTQEVTRSKAIIRKLWPNFNFDPRDSSNNRIGWDLNGDGARTGVFELNGAECLVFFLGGVINNEAPIGFSRNAANPFSLEGSNRLGPFHEFAPDRLKAPSSPTNWYTYVDTYSGQQTPVLYLSSYDGRGYRTVEVTAAGLTDIYRQKAGANAPAWKDKTYQLISPGEDGSYGSGGAYDPNNKNLLTNENDWDNITNFSSGKLR